MRAMMLQLDLLSTASGIALSSGLHLPRLRFSVIKESSYVRISYHIKKIRYGGISSGFLTAALLHKSSHWPFTANSLSKAPCYLQPVVHFHPSVRTSYKPEILYYIPYLISSMHPKAEHSPLPSHSSQAVTNC